MASSDNSFNSPHESTPIDTTIPSYTLTKALEEFPEPSTLDYAQPAKYSADNLRAPLSLQLPFRPTAAKARVHSGCVDMRYSLIRYDPLRGEEDKLVGRLHYPLQAPLGYTTSQPTSVYKTVLTPVSAALASDVVDKNVASATNLIKVMFPEVTAAETITGNARATIRNAADQNFSPERLVWRMASLYLAAAWAEVNDSELFSAQRDLATLTTINSVSAYDSVLGAWDGSTQAIAVRYEGMADIAAPMVSLLTLLGSSNPQLRTTGNLTLPSVASVWPAIGRTTVFYTGPRLPPNEQLGNISSELVWETALLWCGQHGTAELFMEYIATQSTMWCGPVASRAPFFQSDRYTMSLPVSYLQPTILTPISQSYTTWRSSQQTLDRPSKHDLFLQGTAIGMAIGLAVRTYAYKAGMPYVGLINRASTERDAIADSFRVRGDAVGAMFHAQEILKHLGCTGTFGRVILTMSPAFPNVAALSGWWKRHQEAYQWDEIAALSTKLPRCCALMGVVKPLRAQAIPIAGIWYGPDVLVGARSVEEALQGMVYVPDLDLAWQLRDAITGTTTLHTVKRVTNYRGAFSDWQFAPRYSKEFISIEMVFRIRSNSGALMAHSGPMGPVSWKWYVSRPVVEEDVSFSAGSTAPINGSPPPPMVLNPVDPGPHAEHAPPTLPSEQDDDLDVNHEMGPHNTPHNGKQPVNIPAGVVAQGERLKVLLHDSGQSYAWVEQLLLGIRRNVDTVSPWDARDAEGRMRGAWDAVEGLDPQDLLLPIPNGARATAAKLMAQLYRAAAPMAHSPSAAKGWVEEAIRMGNRAQALASCSALTKVELEDWTTKSQVAKAGPAVNERSLKAALVAGVPLDQYIKALARTAEVTGTTAPEPVLTQVAGAEDTINAEADDDFVELLKLSFEQGEVDASTVEAIVGYLPAWATPLDPNDSSPADSTIPITPPHVPADLTASPEADEHVVNSEGETVGSVRATVIPGCDGEQQDFGLGAASTTMLSPMPTPATTTLLVTTPPQTSVPPTVTPPPLATGGTATTTSAPEIHRMNFTE